MNCEVVFEPAEWKSVWKGVHREALSLVPAITFVRGSTIHHVGCKNFLDDDSKIVSVSVHER